MHRCLKSVVAGGVALLSVVLVAGPVAAVEDAPSTVPVEQPATGNEAFKPATRHLSAEKIAARLVARRRTLARLSGEVARAKADCGENAALAAELAAADAGLRALGETMKAETDPAALEAEYVSMYQDFRVYLLMAPKTHLILACDRVLQNTDRLTAWIAKAQAAIDAAAADGADVGNAQTALDAVGPALAAATSAADEASAAVAPLVPDQGDKAVRDSNAATIKSAIGSIKTARKHLGSAVRDAREAVVALRKSKAAKAS